MSKLAAFVKEEGEAVCDESEGTEEEDGSAFDASAEDCTKDRERAEVDGIDRAQAASAFTEGTAEEYFPEGEVDPEADELDLGGVAQCSDKTVLRFGHVVDSGGGALTPFDELFGPDGEFFKAFGMRLREDDFPNKEGSNKGAEDEIEEEGKGTNTEARGRHGAFIA